MGLVFFIFVAVVPFVNHSCIHSFVIVICFVIVWLANLNCICFFSVFNWKKLVTYLIIFFYLWFLYKIRLYKLPSKKCFIFRKTSLFVEPFFTISVTGISRPLFGIGEILHTVSNSGF